MDVLRCISNTLIDALIVTDNNSTAELWQMDHGVLLGSYGLEHNRTKERYVDITFITRKEEKNPSFAILTNQWFKVYTNLKEDQSFSAE